jgi:5-epi-alpha-selinene synthase
MRNFTATAARELPLRAHDTKPKRATIAQTLYCPFPLTLNPHAWVAEQASLQWLGRFGILDGRALHGAAQAHLTTLVAGFYPWADLEQLRIASDYVCWAFALDDLADESEVGERPARLLNMFEELEQVLDGNAARAGMSPLASGLWDVMQRIVQCATPEQTQQFIDGNRAYWGAMLWEANNRATGCVPDETAYNTFRPAAGAVPSFFGLIEPLEKIHLAADVRNHAAVQALAQRAGAIICWTNDLLSYDKEVAQGDVHNLVVVYEHHRGLSASEAAAQAIDLINGSTRRFVQETRQLPSFGAGQDAELSRFVRVLESVMRVTFSWTYESARYTGQSSVEPRSATA